MKEEKRVLLEMTPEQAGAVALACEMMMRLKLGQFNFISEALKNIEPGQNMTAWCVERDTADELGNVMAKLVLGENSMRMPMAQGDATCHVCMDVWHTIRHTLAWDAHPEGGMAVDFYPPILHFGINAPKCRVISMTPEERGGAGGETIPGL